MAFKMYGTMERLDGMSESVIHFATGNSMKDEPKESTEIKPEYNISNVNMSEIKTNTDFIGAKKANSNNNSNIGKTFICHYCSKPFSQNYHLIRHERIHTGERPYQCGWCQKRFQRNEHLTRHIRIHTGEKPYSCIHCCKEFRRNDHLGKHIRTHISTIATADHKPPVQQYSYSNGS